MSASMMLSSIALTHPSRTDALFASAVLSADIMRAASAAAYHCPVGNGNAGETSPSMSLCFRLHARLVLVAVLLHIVGLILFSTFACVYETTLPIAGILHAIAAPIRGRDAVSVLAPASAFIFSARARTFRFKSSFHAGTFLLLLVYAKAGLPIAL